MQNNMALPIAPLSILVLPTHLIQCGKTPSSSSTTSSVTTYSQSEQKLRAQKFIEACTTDTNQAPMTQQITFTILHNNKKVASAQYTLGSKKNCTAMSDFTVQPEYRGNGIGGAFFALTMAEIAKSKLPRVEWIAYPTSIPLGMSVDEATDKLYRFYRAQGATVNEKTGDSSLDLVKAGYLKQEEVKHEK